MQPRISPVTGDRVPERSAGILAGIRKAIGMVPKLHQTLAHSPAALRAYTDMAAALAGGTLDPRLREQIAVATAGANGCRYCASAHTAIGKSLDVPAEELACNLRGAATDEKTAAVLDLVRALLDGRGVVSDAAVARVRAAGFSDAHVVEIVTHVGMNAFTNLFNGFARTEIDFPLVEMPAVG